MSRDPLNIALAVMAVLLLAVGGSYAIEHLRAHGRPAATSTLPAVRSGQKRVTLEVSGMYCSNCAERVARELEATPGVVAADVDVPAHHASVVCERQLADTSLVGAVTRAGTEYTAHIVSH